MIDIKIQAKELVTVLVDDLVLNPNNLNSHPEHQISQLADIIKYQGWRRPITISTRTGVVTCGEGRVLAARMLGMKEVTAMMQDYDSEEQEIADGVADNAIDKQAVLDFAGINKALANFDPSFDLAMLGIKDFKLDVSEKDLPKLPEEKPPALHTCPSCGLEFT